MNKVEWNMSKEFADIVWSYLNQVLELSLNNDYFVDSITKSDFKEFRLMGRTTGFGTKFKISATKWYIDCYTESRHPQLDELYDKINEHLDLIRHAYVLTL